MRLFIAIEFDDKTKNIIADNAFLLKKASCCGNFMLRDNFHLTLAFLGEINKEKLSAVKDAISSVSFPSFCLTFGKIGFFKRDGGDIVWQAVTAPKALFKLHKMLLAELTAKGFSVDSRPFKPHITLARQVIFKNGCTGNECPKLKETECTVSCISLMKSERINGKLTYSPLFKKNAQCA